MGFYVGLSTNGTLIDRDNIEPDQRSVGYDYVGISLDGIGAVHDAFRRVEGAFDASLTGIRLCHEPRPQGRHPLHHDVATNAGATADSCSNSPRTRAIDNSICPISTMPGAANTNRRDDALFTDDPADAMDLLFDTCLELCWNGRRSPRNS